MFGREVALTAIKILNSHWSFPQRIQYCKAFYSSSRGAPSAGIGGDGASTTRIAYFLSLQMDGWYRVTT